MKGGQSLRLRTAPLKFNAIRFNRNPPAVVLTWYADTEVINIFLIRIAVLRLAWPPVLWDTAFTSDEQ